MALCYLREVLNLLEQVAMSSFQTIDANFMSKEVRTVEMESKSVLKVMKTYDDELSLPEKKAIED